jgi:hypothetical protein
VVMRQVAAAAKAVPGSGGGLASLRLLAAPHYRALAARRGGLSASVTVTFTALGHKPLRARITVAFVRTLRRHEAHSSRRAAAGRGRRR